MIRDLSPFVVMYLNMKLVLDQISKDEYIRQIDISKAYGYRLRGL